MVVTETSSYGEAKMTDITITGRIAERLRQLAERTNRSVEEILEDVLDAYQDSEGKSNTDEGPPPGTFARMAWIAERNPIRVGATDISERSREILRDEYAEHLLKRLQASDDNTDD